MKKYFFLATALVALASCSNDEFIGDQTLAEANNGPAPISFNTGSQTLTRADKEGDDAASLLNNNFVVFGYKTVGETTQTVFDNYQANYVASSGNSSESNSAGWEYVNYKSLTANMTGYAGVTGNTTNGTVQSIKYWDYSASAYKFFAYSLGAGKTGDPKTYANATKMAADTYKLEGDADQLAACYISDLTTINPTSSTSKEVDLNFQSINSKLILGFYETIPGYSVKDLNFYESASAESSTTTPVLYAGSSILPKKGTYTVTFDSNGKPLLAWAAAASEGTQSNVAFSATLTNYAAKEYLEAEATNTYLGRASNAATKTAAKLVLPYATGAALTLKVDYTLLSRDGTGETIVVKGATVTIPAAYTQWKPNYAYTYIFKISDNTNGQTGSADEPKGLYPITLDAIVKDDILGNQETITIVSDPSITTYQKGQVVTANDEYTAGTIYVVVGNGTALTVGTNAKLYTATVEDGAAQGITEATVANAITNGGASSPYVVTDANGKKLTVTAVASNLEAITKIPSTDSPSGVDLTINGAKFTAAAGTTYVFEYNNSGTKTYKVIKVVAGS